MEERKPTPEQIKMAVRLCNSGGILICGVMAERRVAELLMIEQLYAEVMRKDVTDSELRIQEVPRG